MDISTHKETDIHLHCEEVTSICVTNFLLGFTTASKDSVSLHLSKEQAEQLRDELKRFWNL